MSTQTAQLDVSKIRVKKDHNAREQVKDPKTLGALQRSIETIGLLQPLIVSADERDGQHELLAGERRLLAAKGAKLTQVPVVYHERQNGQDDDAAVMAVENMVREQFTAVEEARAIRKLLDAGYTEDGCAKALGWTKQRVTRRVRMLELPEKVQALFGESAKAPQDALWPMLQINAVAPWLAEMIAEDATREHSETDLRELAREPDRFIDYYGEIEAEGENVPEDVCLERCPGRVSFYGAQWVTPEIEARVEKRQRLRSQLGEYGGQLELSEADADRARAAGVLLEVEADADKYSWVVSAMWLVDVVGTRLDDDIAALEKRAAKQTKRTGTAAGTGSGSGSASGSSERDLAEKISRDANKRWKEEARGPNLALGRELMNKLAKVETDVDVARFFVYGMLGRRSGESYDYSYMSMSGEAGKLAARGLRLVFEDWQTVVEKGGRMKVSYPDITECERLLWEWLDRADTAAEVFGRGLIIHVAAVHAVEQAVPKSDRIWGVSGRTGNGTAAKALEKIVKGRKALPAALVKLAREIEKFDPAAEAKAQLQAEKKPAAKRSPAKGGKVSGTRAGEALKLVTKTPGITVPLLATAMGVKQNYLYRVLPELLRQGKVEKKGRGWHPVAS